MGAERSSSHVKGGGREEGEGEGGVTSVSCRHKVGTQKWTAARIHRSGPDNHARVEAQESESDRPENRVAQWAREREGTCQ